ncbi:hypothetical protein CCP3SC15_210020 [Gammaproteobacteria bacterium]
MKRFIALLFIVMLVGCSSLKAFKLPDLNLFKHEQKGDVQAVKTGDIAPLKGPVKATAEATVQGAAGAYNTVQTTDNNGTMTQSSHNVNDSTLMGQIFKQAGDGNTRVIILLILLLSRYIYKSNKEDARKMAFINRQETNQEEYIKFLQENIKTLMALVGEKKKEAV